MSGVAESQLELSGIMERLNAIEGTRTIVSDISVLQIADPFRMCVEKFNGNYKVSGHKHTESAFLSELGEHAGNLQLATGMPDNTWPKLAINSIQALELLQDGVFELEGTSLKLIGLTNDPSAYETVSSLFSDLPENYRAEIDLRLLSQSSAQTGDFTAQPTGSLENQNTVTTNNQRS